MTWTTRPRSEHPNGLAVWQDGAGPPLVLVHGVGLRAEAWAAVIPLLTDRFTTYAVDMPGHGQSPEVRNATADAFTERLAGCVQTLGRRVFVAGHSMGALLALELAARLPDEIAGVAALNAIYRRSPDAATAVRARAQALSDTHASDPSVTLERWFGEAPRGALADAAAACRDWLTTGNQRGYKTAYTVFANSDGPDDATLQAIRCPVLFMTAARDPNSTPAMSRAMASQCRKARTEVVPDAAHMMPMTHAAEVAAAMIDTFSQTEAGP